MAESILVRSSLRLILNNGIDPRTDDVIKKVKTFNNLKPSVSADQLFAVAEAFAAVQTLPLYSLERADNSEIVQVDEG